MANFTVKLDKAVIKRLDDAAIKALEQTAEAIHTDLVQSETIPRKTGRLQNEAFFVDNSMSNMGHVELVNEGPYARRLYFHPEYNFHHEPWEVIATRGKRKGEVIDKGDGNPNAGGRWFDPYLPGGAKADYAEKVYARLYKREAGT